MASRPSDSSRSDSDLTDQWTHSDRDAEREPGIRVALKRYTTADSHERMLLAAGSAFVSADESATGGSK
jgi:hypothetical protein